MELFGFIVLVAIMTLLSAVWILLFAFDGCLGNKRDVPLIAMFFLAGLLYWFWSLVLANSPITIVVG